MWTLFLAATLALAPPCIDMDAFCRCVPPAAPDQAFARADAVVLGRVVEVRDSVMQGRAGPFRTQVVWMAVERSWKGAPADTVRLHQGFTSCDYRFRDGGRYLVYARSARLRAGEETLRAMQCSGTAPVDRAADHLRALEGRDDAGDATRPDSAGTGVAGTAGADRMQGPPTTAEPA